MRRVHLALVLSAVLHVSLAAALTTGPLLDLTEPTLEGEAEEGEDQGGDEGEVAIEELLDRPAFSVALYAEPARVASGAAVALVPPPAPTPVVASPPPVAAALEPPPVPPALEPPPVPLADVTESAPPEPTLTDADREALAAIEQGESTAAPLADDDGSAHEAANEGRQRRGVNRVRREREPRTPRRPACPAGVDSIARVDDARWYIDRDLIEYYATNLMELQKLGSVWTHRGADGKLDGFKVGLARCSVLRQGGLKTGDVVHDINGRRINSVLQAIGAYFALRAEPELTLNVTRRGQPVTLAYTIEQPQQRVKRAGRRSKAGQSR